MSGKYQLDGQDSNGETASGGDLVEVVQKLNERAFELAKQVAVAANRQEELSTKARELNGYLDELVPLIMSAPAGDQQSLQDAWTEARQDLMYVLASGQGPSSIRLHHHLQTETPGE